MARLPRLSIGGQVHLLIQRVRLAEKVFDAPADRQAYLQALAEAAARHGVALHGYGLSPSEVRLIGTPPDAQALGRMAQSIGRRFVADFNRRHGRQGGLWEGRFRSTVVEAEARFVSCLRFVEFSGGQGADEPMPESIAWSSGPHHLGSRLDPCITEHAAFWALGNTPFERQVAYAALLRHPLPPQEEQGIALACRSGWALGSDAFIASISPAAGRRLQPRPSGRPKLIEMA